MSDAKKKARRWLALSMAAAAALIGSAPAPAATWLWDPQHLSAASSGTGSWTDVTNAGTATWFNGAADAAWDNTQFLTADFGGAAGTFTVTIDPTHGITAGGLRFDTAGYTVTGGTLTLNESAPGAATITTNASATISSTIAGGANLTQVIFAGGTGQVLTLTGANSYAVGTTLSSGVLRAQSNTALGTGTALTIGGGELQLATSFSSAFAYNTQITGNAQITSDALSTGSGAGNTYTLNSLSIGAQTLTIAGGVNVLFGTAGVTVTGATTLTGAATFNVNDGTPGTTTLLTLGTINTSGNSITFTGSGNTLVTGVIGSGVGGLTYAGSSGSGLLTLTNANTYTGTTTVNSGELDLNSAIGPQTIDSSNVIVNGGILRLLNHSNQILTTANLFVSGTFDIGANSQTLGGVTLAGGAITGTGTTGILTSTGPYNVQSGSISAILAGSVPMIQTTAGIVTLSGANTFNGGLTINGGAVFGTENTGTPFGTGSITLNLGTLGVAPTAAASLTAANVATNSTLTFNVGEISLTKTGGVLSFIVGNSGAAANSVLVRNGLGTLEIAPGNGTGATNLGVNEKLIINGGLGTLTNAMVNPYIVGENNDTRGTGDFLTYGVNGFTIAAYTDTNFTTPTNTKIETVTTARALAVAESVYAMRTAAGATITLNTGGIINIGNGSGFAGLILNNSDILTGVSQTGTSIGFGAAEGVIYAAGNGDLISAPISGSGGITEFGGTTLFLAGANTFTGALTLSGGHVGIIASPALGASTNTVALNAGTLSLDEAAIVNQGITVSSLGGTLDVAFGKTAGYYGSGFSLAGAAPTTTALTKINPGSLDISSPNAFAGNLVLATNGGTVRLIGDTGTLAAPTGGSFTNLAGLTIDPSATFLIDNQNNFGAFTGFVSLAAAANPNRLNGAPITLNGGTFSYTAANSATAGAIQEAVGPVTLLTGASTITATASGQGAEISIPTLIRGNNTTVNFNTTGTPGATGNNGRIILNGFNNNGSGSQTLSATGGMIGGWATVNTGDFASYTTYVPATTTGGVGVVTYNSTNTLAAFASGVNTNLTTMLATPLSGATVTGSLRLSGGTSATNAVPDISFTNLTDTLNIETGGIVSSNANVAHVIGGVVSNVSPAPTIPGFLTAGGTSGTGPVELFIHQNQNTMTINSLIVDNGNRPLTLIKDQGGGLTITGAYLDASSNQFNNTYSGGTVLINSGDVNASPVSNVPGVLGTGAVTINNTRLIINAITSAVNPISNPNSWNVSNNFTYTVSNAGSLQFSAVGFLPNDPNTTLNQQTIRVMGNSELAISIFATNGTPDTASSLVFSGAFQDVKADPGSVIAETGAGALVDPVSGMPVTTNNGGISFFNMGLPTSPTFFFGMEGSFTTNLIVGAGTPWIGISTGRGNNYTYTGGTTGTANNTITYNSDFTLQSFLFNNTLRTLTLGNGTGAANVVQIVPAASVTSANVQVNGNITLNNDQSVYKGVTFVVTPGSTLLLGQNNALGGSGTANATTTANVVVQAGGLLNLSGALTNPINGNVTLEPGASYLADDVTNVGGVLGQLNGAGVLTFQPGSYILLGGGGTNVGLVNALTGSQLSSIPSGVIIRLNTNTTNGVGLLSIGTFGLSSKIQPNQIFEAISGGPNTITTATGGLSFATNPGGDNLNLSGAFLTSGITGGTISPGGGRIIVGALGVTIAGGATVLPVGAGNGSETFVLQEDFDLPTAGLTLTVGSTAVIDGLPKSGTYVNLSTQGSRSVIGGIIDVTNGSQLQLSTSYSTPYLSTLTVESGTSVLINTAANTSNTVGALTGPGTIVSNNAGLLQVGYGDQTSTFTGIFAATGTVGLPFDSAQPNLNKIGAGTLNLTGSSTAAGTLEVIGGTLDINGTAGSVKFATIDLNRGQLTVDYTTGLVTNRLGGVGTTSGPTLTFSGGDLTFLSGGTETFGTVNYNGGGISNINLGNTAVTIVSNQGRSISTIILHGTNVGGGALDGTLLANASQASGTYAAGQVTTAIRPDILSDSTPTGTSANPAFTTYDPTNGYRAITAAETTPNVFAGQNLNNNVQLAAGLPTNLTFPVAGISGQLASIGTDTTLQSLTLGAGASLSQAATPNAVGGFNRININGGGIIAQSGAATTITAPFITGANYIFNASSLTLNATIVNGQQLVKAGSGTLTLGPGAINNADNNFAVNGGTLALGAGSSFLVTGTTGYAARSLFLSGGTLDLMGNSVIVGILQSTNVGSTLPAAGNGNIISTGGTADFSTNAANNFYGTISGIGNLTHFSSNTTNFENSISVSGNVTVRGGSMLLTNLGQITGANNLIVDQGQFEIDNLDSLNFNLQYSGSNLVPVIANRIPAAAGVVLNGGQFTVVSSPGVIDAETFGTGANGFQIASGTNTIAGTVQLNSSANITIGNLVRNAGSHAVVNFTGTNVGNTGELYQVTHFTIAQLNGAAFDPTPTLTNNILGPWAVINGGDWATYSTASFTNAGITLNARGLSNLGNLNSGYANYAVSAGTTLQTFGNGGPNDNLSVGGSQENAGVLTHTIYTLKTSGSILLNSGETLTLAGGGILTNTNAAISLTTVGTGGTSNLTSTYKPAGAPTAELYAWINQNTTSIGSDIVDNGTSPVTLIKSGPNTLTLSAANSYSGGTVVSQGTLTLGDLTADGLSQFSIPKATGITGPDLTIIGATNSTTTVNYTPTFPNGQIAPTAVVELDGTATLQLNPNTGVTNTTTLSGLIFKNTGGGASPTVQVGSGTGGGTLVLKGNITTTNDNYATVPSLTENIPGANTPLAVLDLNAATSTIDTEGLSFLGLNIQTGIQNGAILKIGPGTLGLGVLSGTSTVNGNLAAGSNVGTVTNGTLTGEYSISTLTGGITINAGIVRIDSPGALGASGAGGNTVTINAGGTLLNNIASANVFAYTTAPATPTPVTGNITLSGGTLQSLGNVPIFNGNFIISASSTIAEQDYFYTQTLNRAMTISGPITVVGTPTLSITAAPYANSTGTLLLSNNTNNFTGATIAIGPNAIVQAKTATAGGATTIAGAAIALSGGEINIDVDGTSPIALGNTVTVTGQAQLNIDRDLSTNTGTTVTFGTLSLGNLLTVTASDTYVANFPIVTLTATTNAAINNSTTVTTGPVSGTPASFTKYGASALNLTGAFNAGTAPVTIAQGTIHAGVGTGSFASGPLTIGFGAALENDTTVAATPFSYTPSSVASQGLTWSHTGIMNLTGVFVGSGGGIATGQPFSPGTEKFFTGLANNATADADITLSNSSATFLTNAPFTTGTLTNQRLSVSDTQAQVRARTPASLIGGLWESTFTVSTPTAFSFGLTSDDGSNLYVAPLNGTIANTTFSAANLVILNDGGSVHNGHGAVTVINTTPVLSPGTYVLAVGWYNGSGGGSIEARYYPGTMGAGVTSTPTNPTGGAAEPVNGFQPVPYANQIIIDPGTTPAGALQVDANAQITAGGFSAENVLLNASTTTTPTTLMIDNSIPGTPNSSAQILFVNGASTNIANLDIASGHILTVTQSLGITSGVSLQTVDSGTLLINGAGNATGSTSTGGTLSINKGVVGGTGVIPASSVLVAAGATISAGTSTVLSGSGVTNATGNLTVGTPNASGVLSNGAAVLNGGTGSTGGTYAWKLNVNNAGTPFTTNTDKTGANWDQLTASSINVIASATSQFNVEIISVAATGSNSFLVGDAYSWTAANVTGAITFTGGTVANAFHFDTSNFKMPGGSPYTGLGTFSASVVTDGSLQDLVINYSPVPEPTSFELLGVGMAGLVLRRRRLRKGMQRT